MVKSLYSPSIAHWPTSNKATSDDSDLAMNGREHLAQDHNLVIWFDKLIDSWDSLFFVAIPLW
jgi:hypothetical protein